MSQKSSSSPTKELKLVSNSQRRLSDLQTAGRKAAQPFCSRHCAHIDLGHWINESYSIPAHEAMDDTDIDAMLKQADEDGGLKMTLPARFVRHSVIYGTKDAGQRFFSCL